MKDSPESCSKRFANASPGTDPVVLSNYPTPGELRNLLYASDDSFSAVIVDLGIPEQGLELVRAVSESFPQITAMAADVVSKAESILGAMRAGAAEYLIPPFDVRQLRDTLQQRARKERAARPKGKLVCFMPAQGGNGASTLAVHTANAISRESDGKVLLIDFDFHSGTVAFRLRLKPEFTFVDAVSRIDVIDELWPRIVSSCNGLDVLPSPVASTDVPREMQSNLLHEVFESATRLYSCVVVDLPNALFSSSRYVLQEADAVYLVATAEIMSLHLARRRINQLMQIQVPQQKIKLVVNRVGAKRGMDAADISKVVGASVDWRFSNDYSVVTDSYVKGTLIPAARPWGKRSTSLPSTSWALSRRKSPRSGSSSEPASGLARFDPRWLDAVLFRRAA